MYNQYNDITLKENYKQNKVCIMFI